MGEVEVSRRWLISVVRVPPEPSRHRVGVWRELRRVGAIPLGAGVWATPEAPVFVQGLNRVRELVDTAGGTLISLDSEPRDASDKMAMVAAFNNAREAEWGEFRTECSKFKAEIASEHGSGKYTVAKLDEEEQRLERLRRLAGEIKIRDIFSVPEAEVADRDLRGCVATLEDYADHIYRHAHTGSASTGKVPPKRDG